MEKPGWPPSSLHSGPNSPRDKWPSRGVEAGEREHDLRIEMSFNLELRYEKWWFLRQLSGFWREEKKDQRGRSNSEWVGDLRISTSLLIGFSAFKVRCRLSWKFRVPRPALLGIPFPQELISQSNVPFQHLSAFYFHLVGHRSSSIRPMINDNLSCSEAEVKIHSY